VSAACGKIPCVPLNRLSWIAMFTLTVPGMILDVGAADASTWIYYAQPPPVERVVLLDCDVWLHAVKFPFVRGDGHRLPFKDGCFDTVVLGDVLEHCVDPLQLLREAKRVCRLRIVATVPEEGAWKQDVQPTQSEEPNSERNVAAQLGKVPFHTPYATTVLAGMLDNNKYPHQAHIRMFTLDSLLQLLTQLDMTITLGHLHHQQIHFGVLMEKEGNG